MIAVALAFLLQTVTPSAPESSGSIVRLDPNSMSAKFLSHYPVVSSGGGRIVILAIYLDGDLTLLEQIKGELMHQGWQAGLVTPPGRPTGLSISSRDKKFEQANALLQHLRAKEFGDVQIQPLTERVPAGI